MSAINKEMVETALCRVIDRDSGQDVMAAGLVSDIAVQESRVAIVLTILPQDKDRKAYLREACENEVRKLPGVAGVTAVLTAQSEAKPDIKKPAVWNLTPIEGVKKIIAVASGKGGVGKSTTAVNLALALAKSGKRVGVLDADIYGPSIPRMLGLSGRPEIVDDKMVPLRNHGVTCMSVGFLMGDQAAILRGPMISKTLHQLLRATRWGTLNDPLDVLLVDMPPGTGDIHLSLAQQVPLSGAVIVTTPQAVAVMDARKCLIMFQKVNVKVLGVIENMSGSVFGEGGGKMLAEEMNVPFLGDIPMDGGIVRAADSGKAYNGENTPVFSSIAGQLLI